MAESDPNPSDVVIFFNPIRHEHKLCLSEGLLNYTCSGCKEFGANTGYKCSSSSCGDFTLHQACATLPDVYEDLCLSDSSFKFRPKTNLWHHCDACQDMLNGFTFETESNHLRLHPLCMRLPEMLDFSGHANHKLIRVTDDSNGKVYSCSKCNSQIDSGAWRYRCKEVACNVYLDLSCAKIDIFGLSKYGIERVAPVSMKSKFKSKLPTVGSVGTLISSVGTVVSSVTGVMSLQ